MSRGVWGLNKLGSPGAVGSPGLEGAELKDFAWRSVKPLGGWVLLQEGCAWCVVCFVGCVCAVVCVCAVIQGSKKPGGFQGFQAVLKDWSRVQPV